MPFGLASQYYPGSVAYNVLYPRLFKRLMSLESSNERPNYPVALMVILAGVVLLDVADTSASVGGFGISDNEVASSVGEASNSSASAIITIRMATAPLPDE